MRVLRPFAVLVFLLALGASGAAASPAPRPAGLPEAEPFAFHVSSLLARLESLLAGVWGKEGCRVDPWGRCTPTAPTTDAGCRADPWGRCIESTPTTDAGCGLEPWGRCEPNQ